MTTAQTCAVAQHATFSTTTADTVAFTGTGSYLCVTNRDATNTVYFRVDGVTAVADPATLTLQADSFLRLTRMTGT